MKKVLSVLLAIFANSLVFAQNTLEIKDTGNITRERWRDSLLRMDKNQIPTGFLLEYSMFGFDSNKYDGVGNDDDTIKNNGRIFELHNILWNSKVNNNATIDITDTLYSKAFFYNSNNNVIPLTFIYQKYNRIRQTALSQSLLKIAPDSVGILDVAGRTVSPYDVYEAFAFAPFKTSITQFNAIQFTLPADLFYMQGITGVDIDFGDGVGFRTIAKGGTISIYYATTGIKYLTAKITTTSGIRIAKSMVDYKRPAAFYKPDYSLNIQADPVYTSDAQYLQNGTAGPVQTTGTVIPCGDGSFIDQLLCSQKPNANIDVINGCDKVFDKPIIVVEGFDPDGQLTITTMEERFRQNQFMSTMQGYGYDFVFVNFTKNTTYIENNAKVLEAVINWVNLNKTGTFKSTVIGYSMGGLVARWCLKDMEDRGLQHNVANYFSYDTPHQGVNIPLGMQYIFKEMIRDLPYLKWFNAGGFGQLSDAFNSPAARQMLVTYAEYSNSPFNWTPNLTTLSPLRSAFAQRLQTKGYPQQTRNFGLAFGRGNNTAGTKDAGNGRQFTPASSFNPQTQIFSGALSFFLVNLQTLANAVPENNTKATIAYYDFLGITFRKVFGIPFIPVVTLRVRRFDYTGQYPYDDAPGSFEQTQTQFVQNWKRGVASTPTTNSHDGHNFVSSASALDLQNQTYSAATKWQSSNMFGNIDNQIQNPGQVNGNTLLTPSLSPFRAVMTGTSNCVGGCNAQAYINENNSFIDPVNSSLWNHFHETAMTFQFARFIETNILNSTPIDCAGTNGLCNSNPTIQGLNPVCTTGQYQLINVPSGVSILWEIQNGKLNIDNGQGTPIINVSKIGTGDEIIKVTITNTCGASLVLTRSITVGTANININYSMTGSCNGTFQSWNLNASSTSTVSNWLWTVDNPANNNWVIYSPNSANTLVAVTGGGGISVTATNACGTSRSGVTIWSNCHSLMATPNPATDNVNVTIEQPASTATAKATKVIMYQINITDLAGNVKKQYKYSAGVTNTNVSLRGLSKGVYLIQAFDRTSWSSVQVIKQ